MVLCSKLYTLHPNTIKSQWHLSIKHLTRNSHHTSTPNTPNTIQNPFKIKTTNKYTVQIYNTHLITSFPLPHSWAILLSFIFTTFNFIFWTFFCTIFQTILFLLLLNAFVQCTAIQITNHSNGTCLIIWFYCFRSLIFQLHRAIYHAMNYMACHQLEMILVRVALHHR